MGWQDLISSGGERVLPWLGGRSVYSKDRTWTIKGRLPKEFGWYTFDTSSGRTARLRGEAEIDPDYEEGLPVIKGYLVGDRLIADDARVDPDPAKLCEQTEPVFCVELGLDRFSRALVVRDRDDRLIFMRLEFPAGPEADVLAAYQDRKDTVTDIPEVTPALDLAFRWISYQRAAAEARAAELVRLRAEEEARLAEEERKRRLFEKIGTGEGRRKLAAVDFNAAAKAALAVGGAEFLDATKGYQKNERVVQYRYRNRRLECVCDLDLRIVDAGVCLDNHRGTKGDTWFTLESLPTVIGEAMDLGKLIVWRGREAGRDYDWDEERW